MAHLCNGDIWRIRLPSVSEEKREHNDPGSSIKHTSLYQLHGEIKIKPLKLRSYSLYYRAGAVSKVLVGKSHGAISKEVLLYAE